jgi:hypothetical protein
MGWFGTQGKEYGEGVWDEASTTGVRGPDLS